MPTREPLFDLFSYARPGPGRRDRLSLAEIEQIARTVRRTPEVMVKVLPRGAQSAAKARVRAQLLADIQSWAAYQAARQGVMMRS